MGRDRASRPEAKPLRLFAAVDVPDRAKDAVLTVMEPWRERLPGGRWVKPENWHVTVKFLGRTWPRLVDWVRGQLAEAASTIRPFRLGLGGLGMFPSPGRARVLWVGLDDPERSLLALAAAVEERLGAEFPPEKRPFSGHLTVARFDPPVRMGEHADALSATRPAADPFRVEHLTLYRSHLSPRGARYEPLERFPLARR
jgi:RNA 2',3'-cyclic 3'-phosphodiesterase